MGEEPAEQPSRAGKPMEMPSDMKAFNRAVIEEFRANGGRLSGPMAGRSLILLTTNGARSGEKRTAVIGYGRDGDRFVVVAANAGADAHPGWYHNLLAEPSATVELGDRTIPVLARTTEGEERERAGAVLPWFRGQQEKTSRRIPVVVLEPVER